MFKKGFIEIVVVVIVGIIGAFFLGKSLLFSEKLSTEPVPVIPTTSTSTSTGSVGTTTNTTKPVVIPKPTPQQSTTTATTTVQVPTSTSTNPSFTTVYLGQEFTMKLNRLVKVSGTNLGIKITQFYYHPCPQGVQCIWSGLSVTFEYYLDNKVVELYTVQNAGYEVRMVKTDYQTYANMLVTKTK